MKSGYRLFLFLFAFYAIVGAIYWWLGGEPLGVTAIFLSAGLALIIGYYFWFINRRTGGVLPEDNPDALISDGAGELGFYSPHSWWPLPVGLAATAWAQPCDWLVVDTHYRGGAHHCGDAIRT